MNETNVNTKVGFFVAIGIITFMLSILLFSGEQNLFSPKYKLQAIFKSTQGLAEGSVVSLAGVEVGNITSISFSEKMELVAELTLLEKYKNRITTNALASIRTQGALGDKYIYISPGDSPGTVIDDNGILPTDTQPDFFESITQKAADINIADTIRELNQLLVNLNANGRSGLLMENFVSASQNVSKLMNEPSIRESFQHLRNILRKLDQGEGTLGQLINDSSLHSRLTAILGESPRNKYLKPLIREAIKQNEQDAASSQR